MASNKEVVVAMVPFVTQGHLNQLLHLSRIISAYNLPVHFICTATHIRQARLRVHGPNSQNDNNNNIIFHELPDLDFISPPPNPNGPNGFPSHLIPSINSSLNLRGPVADIIRSLSKTSRRVAVVHDSAMSYVVQDVKMIPNAETYVFRALSVFYSFCFSFERLGKEIPFENETIRKIPTSAETMSREFLEFVKIQYSHQTFHVGNIYDSSRAIEGRFLEKLEKDEIYGKNHWAVGPFNGVKKLETDISASSQNRDTSLQWLDKQPSKSVIYVSFGTTTTFTDEQIKELAIGLEKSGQRFLWVLRDADKGDVFKNEEGKGVGLPKGFEERVQGRGLVVRKWAPQVEILGHSATAGFVSHCGWNSCMEALTAGVPIATWPFHSDQPRNAFLLVDVLGVALTMKEWASRNEVLTSAKVEEVIRKLMDTKEGTMIKKRAADLGDDLRRSMDEDGVTSKELDSLISYIRR
uniref:zeatin O-glucosyltransferase-like n=1 Tax=Erigeron canadensis TaxID=72917 RepID=UPI001CB9D7DD|nr:zeatin O-glucosyltransferase-like [Erigeron canadensis]